MYFYLSSCWLKACFCSAETLVEGNPGACRASFSHWDRRAGQCLFNVNSTSEKCSVRLRGDSPPTAWGKKKITKNLEIRQTAGIKNECTGLITGREWCDSSWLTCSMVSVSSFPSVCNTSVSDGTSLQRGNSSVCQVRAKILNQWADEVSVTTTCTILPPLTKNRLAAFTVGVSGNFSDKIPGDKNRVRRFF